MPDLTPTPEERQILESPREILLVHGPDGRLKRAILGAEGPKPIPSDLPPGSTVSRNDPSGRGPGLLDLLAALTLIGATLRVVLSDGDGGQEIYQLRNNGNVDPAEAEAAIRFYEETVATGDGSAESQQAALAALMEAFPGLLEIRSRTF